MTLSYKVGSLQVREEELSSMLKLKVQQHYMFQQKGIFYIYCPIKYSYESFCWCVNVMCFPHQDKDVVNASGHIIDLTVRLRELEALLKESGSRENKLLKDLEELKRRHREAKHGISQLKGTHLKLEKSPL